MSHRAGRGRLRGAASAVKPCFRLRFGSFPMLDKTYNPAEVEEALYAAWERAGDFAARPGSDKKPYTIMMPPPNVTGSLHIGHALTFTLQDILIRYHRMVGRDALWQPGTDHAGIATQMVVERQLAQSGTTRQELGRENFIARVWAWKEQSGGTITHQLRRLGASPDWARERFTMDEGLSKAVVKVFVELYRQELIYRDKRLVNWDSKLHTAISDLEVENREMKGKMWYFKYPIEGREGEFITVGTTRPETMLGDTAVAVHPDDARYTDLVGKFVILPITGRRIPIVPDEYADPEKGTGAVKITPAHDFNDFAVGKRHGLPMINVLDRDGNLNENAPAAYQGVERFKARDKIVAEMEALGLLEKVETNAMTVPYGDRSGVVIEPWLTDQWYCDAATLAAPCIKAVEDGRTRFVPKSWENTYFEWMRNIQPWCISRQLWWGHQIPAWFGHDGEIFVAYDAAEAQDMAIKHYGKETVLTRDSDVLDTWFSSALWPFSTLGWPEKTAELDRYYPGDVLVTGFDIIFFWVARMMMMGMHFMKDVPFKDVYIHALVRDEKGQKMSKSKGNVLDPLDLCNSYGTDAVRFTLTAMAAQGRDIKLSEGRIAGYRNFITKIWNASRFCQMNGCMPVPGFDPRSVKGTLNKWIVAKVADAAKTVSSAIEAYRFNDTADGLYRFTWNTFCDWYLEFTKPVFLGSDEALKAETRATTAWVIDQILIIAQPMIPFVTQELWDKLAASANQTRPYTLINAPWPKLEGLSAPEAEIEIDWLVDLISAVRSIRSEMNIPPSAKLPLHVRAQSASNRAQWIERYAALIETMSHTTLVKETGGQVTILVGQDEFALAVVGFIDLDKERDRLSKEIAQHQANIAQVVKKMSNEAFVAKAPPEVVQENRDRQAAAEAAIVKLTEALARLG